MVIKTIFDKLFWDLDLIENGKTITFINPYSYLLLRKYKALKEIDCIGVDGISLKAIFNLFLKNKIIRKSFDTTSLASLVYKSCIENKKTIYFIGSTEENIENFVITIRKQNPNLNIIGFRSGFFNSEEDRICSIKKIIQLSPNYVIIGMGTLIQEDYMLSLKTEGYKGVSFTCGGYFHQTTNNIEYYPKFFNKFNLRWLYRVIDEPYLFKRYLFKYPQSFFLLSNDFFEFYLDNRQKLKKKQKPY